MLNYGSYFLRVKIWEVSPLSLVLKAGEIVVRSENSGPVGTQALGWSRQNKKENEALGLEKFPLVAG